MTQAVLYYSEVLTVAGEQLGLDELRTLEKVLGLAINNKLKASSNKAGKPAKKAAPKLRMGGDRDVYDEEPDLMSGFTGGAAAAAAATAAAAGGGGGEGGEDKPFKRTAFAEESSFM